MNRMLLFSKPVRLGGVIIPHIFGYMERSDSEEIISLRSKIEESEREIERLEGIVSAHRDQRLRDISRALSSIEERRILDLLLDRIVSKIDDLQQAISDGSLIEATANLSRARLVYVRQDKLFITRLGIKIANSIRSGMQ